MPAVAPFVAASRAIASIAAAAALALSCGGATLPPQGSIGVRGHRDPETHQIVISDVPKGLSGAEAGLLVNDEIVAIDGQAVASMSAREFQRAVRGPVGSKVIVTIRRQGALRDVEVERGAMHE